MSSLHETGVRIDRKLAAGPRGKKQTEVQPETFPAMSGIFALMTKCIEVAKTRLHDGDTPICPDRSTARQAKSNLIKRRIPDSQTKFLGLRHRQSVLTLGSRRHGERRSFAFLNS
jgi:hypothetical protein